MCGGIPVKSMICDFSWNWKAATSRRCFRGSSKVENQRDDSSRQRIRKAVVARCMIFTYPPCNHCTSLHLVAGSCRSLQVVASRCRSLHVVAGRCTSLQVVALHCMQRGATMQRPGFLRASTLPLCQLRERVGKVLFEFKTL